MFFYLASCNVFAFFARKTNNLAFFIGSLIHIFSETILLLSFMLFLFIYNPLLTLILTICFILISLTIYFLTKNQTYKIGAKRQKLDTKRFKLLQFSFGPPIKDIKLLGLEENYSKNYFDAQTKYASITALMLFIQSLPKILFEIIFIFALSSLILILIFLDSSFNEIIMTLSIFGVVGFRLMPSFSKLLTHFNSIRFTKSGVDAIYNEYKKLKDYPIIKSKIEKFSFLKSIELKKIFYNFSRENKNLFNNFNLIIKKGMSIGIIGQSGTGKTTLINLISGLISLKEGEILVDNINIKSNLKGWQKNIGYVSQNVHLNDDTIKKNVAIGLSDEEIDSQKVIEVLSKARLLDFINKQKNQLETVVGERGVLVSGGQLQRIGIARALYNNPNLLILDEATSNLDLKTEEEIIKIVNDLKTNNLTVIIVSHRTSTLKFCDEVINLDNQ